MQVLRSIVEAVGGQVEVIVDGGFTRGTDIIKAIALGATAVCLGKMQAWALAAGGRRALLRMLEILEEELVIAMALVGVNTLPELTPYYIEPSLPVGPAHPLAAFPVLMERLGPKH
jgi:isopentenyl diphosphate isomerase/L-lactate dehydrogenase-like FMN-dependent dehydrogenase